MTTVTRTDHQDIAIGVKMSTVTVVLSTYTTGGIPIDLTGIVNRKIHSVTLDSVEHATVSSYHWNHYHWIPRIADRTSVSEGLKLLAFRAGNSAYDSDNAATAGVAVYRDEDADGHKLNLFVSPTDTDSPSQQEQMFEIGDGDILSNVQVQLTIYHH